MFKGFFERFNKKNKEKKEISEEILEELSENLDEVAESLEESADEPAALKESIDESIILEETSESSEELSENSEESADELVALKESIDESIILEETSESSDEVPESLEEKADELAVLEESVDESAALEETVDNLELATEIVDKNTSEELEENKGFFKKIFSGLNKTRKKITDQIDNILHNYGEIDDDLFDELEEILIMSDISMNTALDLVSSLKQELIKRKINDSIKVKEVLRDVIANYMNTEEKSILEIKSPSIILVIGVNGVGKTTTIGKMAYNFKKDGKKVLLAAADTFRAAAIDQLEIWGEKAGVDVIAHSEGSDPSAVIYDSISAAKARKTDVLICDTAGRLHNKVNLMNELNKMFRVIDKQYPEASREVLLVLDSTTGQNAINQAKLFKEAAEITGLVLTKLDGTAKGGFVVSIKKDLNIPVKFIGVGEKIDDLQIFNSHDFASALMDLD